MSPRSLLIPILCASLCCVSVPAQADGNTSNASAVTKVPLPPPPPPPPPPPEASPELRQLYDKLVGPPPAPPSLPPIDPSKPQSDPTAGELAPPFYPEDEICRNIGGETLLLLSYDMHGKVVNVEVQRSSGNRDLDRSAYNAARTWHVTPGLRNGFRVGGQVVVPVNFSVDDRRGPLCDSSVRLQALVFGRKLSDTDEARMEVTNVIKRSDTALLQVTYVAVADKPAVSISVDWYRDGGSRDPIFHSASEPLAPGRDKLEFRLGFKSGWQPGSYHAVVSVDGRFRRALQFVVADEEAAPAQAEATEVGGPFLALWSIR